MWPKISRTVIRLGLRHNWIDWRSFPWCKLYWIILKQIIIIIIIIIIIKLFYSPPPQQMLIFWFKDNLGWISTTENCSFFFLFYDILRWLSQSYEHEDSIETSGQEGSILPHWGVACYDRIAKDLRHPGQFTEQAMKQEIFIENICDLVMWH